MAGVKISPRRINYPRGCGAGIKSVQKMFFRKILTVSKMGPTPYLHIFQNPIAYTTSLNILESELLS